MRVVNTTRFRRSTALLVVVAVVIVFVVRLIDVQVVSASALSAEAKNKRAVPVSIPSVRGDIVDRDGTVLATTDERYDVQLSPKNTLVRGGAFYRTDTDRGVGNVEVTKDEAYAEIGEITGQTADDIAKIVSTALKKDKDSDFAYVKRGVNLSQLNELKALEIPWLTFESQYRRLYPDGAVAGNIVGFTSQEAEAQSGIELSQDKCLTGTDGSEVYERSADGVALPGSVVVEKKAVDGGSVKLSIDADLNWQAQQAIDKQVKKVSAEWGYIVVMNAKTGELVAVAEDGSVDPNDVDASDGDKREARSFTSPYEPGSTFKTLTAAALVNEGKATPTSENLTPDHLEPEEGVRFNDSFTHGEMPWTLTGILTQSSNVGISMLGSRLPEQTRYEYLKKFGIGQSTAAGMPLEDSGMLAKAGDWDRQTSYNTMFGQGLSSTIVQTAGAYQALANSGVRVPPTIVESCTSSSGKVTKPDHGKKVRVVKKSTAKTTLSMLENVATQAWFKDMVSIPGYRIGGKTGTAEQVDPETGRYRTDYVNSFAGVFPIDDPQFVIVSSVAFAHSGDGGTAAITAFHDAAEATIRTFQVPPSTGKVDTIPTEY